MSRSAFEDLIQLAAGDDGAASIGRPSTPPAELDGLLEAWSIERHRSIEFEFLLDESRAVIARLLAAERHRATPVELGEIQALLRRINDQLDERSPDRA